jgi:predicted MFS family arabinose efflux permease
MGLAGPALAAFILTFLSWEWIFYVNLPLGVIALIAGWRVFPGPFGEPGGRFDLIGALLLAAMTISTLLAVDALSAVSLAWLGIALSALVLYGRHARRARNPVVRVEHILSQPYGGLALSTGLLLTGTTALSSYIPLYVRAGLEGSPGLTAWSVLPLTVGWTIGAIISSRLADRHPESWIVFMGFMVSIPSLGLAWAIVSSESVLLAPLFGVFFTAGIGVGLATNAALTLLRAVTATSSIGRAAAAHLFARNQGFTFGAAIGGAVLLFVVTLEVGDVELVRELIVGDGVAPEGAAAAVRSGFAASVGVGLVLTILGSMAALRMRRSLAGARAAKRGS